MKKGKTLFILGTVWELIRFFLLFIAIVSINLWVIYTVRQAIFWLLLFGAAQFLMPASFIFLWINPKKYHAFVDLLKIGKMVSIFASFLVILTESFGSRVYPVHFKYFPFTISPIIIIGIISLFDLILFFVLISYRINNDKGSGSSLLPGYSVTDVKELDN